MALKQDNSKNGTGKPSDEKALAFKILCDRLKLTQQEPSEEEIRELAPFDSAMREIVAIWQEKRTEEAVQNAFDTLLRPPFQYRKYFMRIAGEPTQAPAKAETEEDERYTLSKKGNRIFRVVREDDIDKLPNPKWLVSFIFLEVAVSLIFGESSVGKTFSAIHFAQCVARGMMWFGRRVKQGRVLYIYAEGEYEAKLRLQAWRKWHEKEPTSNIDYIMMPVQIIAECDILMTMIKDLEEENGEEYALVIVDTFSNCAEGINQSDPVEVGKVLAVAHIIKRTFGLHVMVTHHTNKQGGFNGAMAFKNHVDTMIELKQEKDDSPIVMHCEKQRGGAGKFRDINLALEVVDLGTDEETLEPITSCVVVSPEVASQKEKYALEQEAKTQKERQMLMTILRQHGKLSTNQWKRHGKAHGIEERAFTMHSDALFQGGQVEKIDAKGEKIDVKGQGKAVFWIPSNTFTEKETLLPFNTSNAAL